jgi:Na+-transporting NADH:ubiquinone oxidoreductase subunit NqrF
LTPEEESVFTPGEIKNGFRLACQAFPQSDVIIEVLPESISSPQRLQVEGEETSFIIDPTISILDLQLISP